MVTYQEIDRNNYTLFHNLANAYYREGEDATTPQAEIDAFIDFLFQKVVCHEISGFLVKQDHLYIGFALWAVDTEDFAFSQLPGFGTIVEISLIPSCRRSGHGSKMVSHIEQCLCSKNIKQCYVSAYGPAQAFWTHCGYVNNGKTASNGLPIMAKNLA